MKIVYYDARDDVEHVEKGMVRPILHKEFLPEIIKGYEVVMGREGSEPEGEYKFFLVNKEGSELMGEVVHDSDSITAE